MARQYHLTYRTSAVHPDVGGSEWVNADDYEIEQDGSVTFYGNFPEGEYGKLYTVAPGWFSIVDTGEAI